MPLFNLLKGLPAVLLVLWPLITVSPTADAASPVEALHQTLEAGLAEDDRVVLVDVGDVKAIQALLEQGDIQPDSVKKSNNPAYYATKLIHRLRRYGKLWIIYDERESALGEALETSFFSDYQTDIDQAFGHLRLVSVINDFVASPDNRIALDLVTKVNHVVTDLTVLPNGNSLLVATKKGEVHWVDLKAPESSRVILSLNDALEGQGEIFASGESGLIGLALHPRFPDQPTLYLHYNLDLAGGDRVARIASWTLDTDGMEPTAATSEVTLLDIPQPETNHNGGALRFGGDGYLYIAVGDGEEGEWVKGRSPRNTLRGKVLRIDVDRQEDGHAYTIPGNNPFIDDSDFPPETWAWGFRNPWRITFTPDGRMLAGDVGEDRYEEVTEVVKGRHHGWPEMEGDRCRLEDRCDPKTSIIPLHHYEREAGMSVTGGEVYEGNQIEGLKNHYIFGDFSSGRMWAMPLSDTDTPIRSDQVTELGRWTVEFTTFAKAPDGEIYTGDLRGKIYRLAPLANTKDVDS